MSNSKITLRALIATWLLLCLSACNVDKAAEHDNATAVSITNGQLQGTVLDNDTLGWLGIPYAAAPIGERRWTAPQPAANWQGVRDATRHGSACIQLPNATAGASAPESELVVGSEDCLFLDVYAPRRELAMTATDKLPVMVWIHGGANIYGSAEFYSGVQELSQQDVIVVAINYRLGLLGWFRHAALRDGVSSLEDRSGNFGSLDIIAALQWVQDNISSFGGDPNKVTVFGESAGGRNTWSMILSPLAKGLFHRAIVQSGSLRYADPNKAEGYSKDNLDYPSYQNNSAEIVARALPNAIELNARELAEALRALSPDQLYAAIDDSDGMRFIMPKLFIDGHVFPHQPLEALRDPALYNSVPIITGTTRYESKLYVAFDDTLVGRRLGLLPYIKDEASFMRNAGYGADIWRALSVDTPAALIAAHGGNKVFTYRYDFDEFIQWPVDLKTLLGAAHATELMPLLGWYQDIPYKWLIADDTGAATLANSMASYWAEFAYSGDPGSGRHGELAKWSSLQAQPAIMLLDNAADGGIRLANEPMSPELISQRLQSDESLDSTEKCAAYLELFLNNYQMPDFFDNTTYRAMGC